MPRGDSSFLAEPPTDSADDYAAQDLHTEAAHNGPSALVAAAAQTVGTDA